MAQAETLALAGQIVVVTGASSGLGRATAVALAHAGANLVLLARSADELARTAAQVKPCGRRALAVPLDLAHTDQIVAAVEQAVRGSAASTWWSTPPAPTRLVRSSI
jgi:NAD(P)-dependent dehydrogenase (short-subunit alcohol dehydrogenase family)